MNQNVKWSRKKRFRKGLAVLLALAVMAGCLPSFTVPVEAYAGEAQGASVCQHTVYENGFCLECGAYEPAKLVTAANYRSLGLTETYIGDYAIGNGGQLYWFAALVNGTLTDGTAQNLAVDAVLTADIQVNDTTNWERWGTDGYKDDSLRPWTPIGYWDKDLLEFKCFEGNFDGAGHTVSGLFFGDISKYYIALFGASKGTIRRVGVEKSYFIGRQCVSGICARNEKDISDCYSTATVECRSTGELPNLSGGICSINMGNIANCYNAGLLLWNESGNENWVGSICGSNLKQITNCWNNNAVQGDNPVPPSIYEKEGELSEAEAAEDALFKSGWVAYALNKGLTDGSQVWRQNIGTDGMPKFTGQTVYSVEKCSGDVIEGRFTNNGAARILHDWSAEWTVDEAHHWHACQTPGCRVTQNSEKDGYAPHTWTDGTVIKAATCTEKGLRQRVCSGCGHVSDTNAVIPALGHSYTSKVTKRPTTNSEGIRTYTCSRCSDSYTKKIPKLEEPEKKSISGAKISGISSRIYTGGKLTQPNLKVVLGGKTLNAGTDYTVSYKNNINIGTASVIIRGAGQFYTGTVEKSFTIKVVKKRTYTVGRMKYRITNASTNGTGTVTLTGTTRKRTDRKFTALKVGNTVKIGGKSFRITAVGSRAFRSYGSLKKVILGNNVRIVGTETFSGCKRLRSVTLGTGIVKISQKAFYKCKTLKLLVIKSGKLKRVEKNAIAGIYKKAVIRVLAKKQKTYRKLFRRSTGYRGTMKIKSK